MVDPDVIELEVTWPMRVQYATVKLRAARIVPDSDEPGVRDAAWDDLADELAEQMVRQAERVATRGLRDQAVSERRNGSH